MAGSVILLLATLTLCLQAQGGSNPPSQREDVADEFNKDERMVNILSDILGLPPALNDTDPALNEVRQFWADGAKGQMVSVSVDIVPNNKSDGKKDDETRIKRELTSGIGLVRKKRTYGMPCMVCGVMQPIGHMMKKLKHKGRGGGGGCNSPQCGAPPPCHPQSPCGQPVRPPPQYYQPVHQPQTCNVCQQGPQYGHPGGGGGGSYSWSQSSASSQSGSWGRKK